MNKLKYNKKYIILILFYKIFKINKKNNYGDWGLGIGDWAQSPIPK